VHMSRHCFHVEQRSSRQAIGPWSKLTLPVLPRVFFSRSSSYSLTWLRRASSFDLPRSRPAMTSSSPKAPARSFPSRRPCPVLAPGCEGDKRRPQDWSSRRQLVEKIVGRCGVPSSEVCRFHVEAALAADEVFGLLARPTRRPRVSIILTAAERKAGGGA
jgi:hypothetical protein